MGKLTAAEVIEQLKLAEKEGRVITFSHDYHWWVSHINCGTNSFVWTYECCDGECGYGDYDVCNTIEELLETYGIYFGEDAEWYLCE